MPSGNNKPHTNVCTDIYIVRSAHKHNGLTCTHMIQSIGTLGSMSSTAWWPWASAGISYDRDRE